ncbi:MAG: nuclear transport factor 2 family protein, partial [Gemmatimonadota bacterium]
MRIRVLTPFLAIAALACTAETADEPATAEDPQEYASNADAASIASFVNDWQTHYNMGHGAMVAGYFSEDGLMWSGSQGMIHGSQTIAAALQGEMDLASPQITIGVDDQVIRGNFAVVRGTYSAEGTIDGEVTANSGQWMSFNEMIDGEWKVHGLISNIGEGQEAPGFQSTEMPEPHESAAMGAEGASFFETHFNMGHPDMIAERYAENAVLMGTTIDYGRDALIANLTELTDAGAQVTITPFASSELGDDYVMSIGTYTMEIDGAASTGHYSNLALKTEDGSLRTLWSLTS